jgi:hypothetical protein
VAANDKAENRARPGSIPWPEPRPLPWPGGGQRARWSADWWRAQFGSPARIRELAAQELTTGRLLPWFAVAYGAGVVLYFTAEREPALWAAAVPAAACALGAVLLRRQIVPHVIAIGLFGIALGFAVQHPVMRFPASGVTVAGLSNCARRASTPIVSCCASTASTVAASRKRRGGNDFVVESARPKSFDRPWSPAPAPRQPLAATSGESGQAEIGSRVRDATPRQEDIEADQSRSDISPGHRRAIPGLQFFQYRRNKPTSLPWMRTRLGGRMRTS